jgi:LytS/YehU family sensor histidine kinase
LIDTENEKAQSFLEKFAEVYRYVLKNKDSEVIRLATELQFLDAYIYLINTRFEHQLEVQVNIDPSAKEKYLPTLTIQMLVENALKHNKFSRKDKLKIQISSSDDLLLVSNNYNPIKPNSYEKKQGSGLRNIEKRYKLLSSQKPIIKISNDQFSVNLPLLNLD